MTILSYILGTYSVRPVSPPWVFATIATIINARHAGKWLTPHPQLIVFTNLNAYACRHYRGTVLPPDRLVVGRHGRLYHLTVDNEYGLEILLDVPHGIWQLRYVFPFPVI